MRKGIGILLATVCLIILMTAPAARAEFPPAQRPDCLCLAIAIDVSGSMRGHGFDQAKEAIVSLLRELRSCDIFYLIPFAEIRLEGFRGELTAGNRDPVLAEAGAFVEALQPGGQREDIYGHYTNLDEGTDAAMLAVLRESGTRKGIVILVTDGVSDPDPLHRPVDLASLAERIPKEGFSLYLIDLSGRQVRGLEPTRIGEFPASSFPKAPLVVIPLQDAGGLLPLLRQVEEKERPAPPPSLARGSSPLPPPALKKARKDSGWPKALWFLPIPAIVLLAGALALRGRQRQPDPTRERQRLRVRVDHQEAQRYDPPITLTLGSGEEDTLRVAKAKPGELTLKVGAGGEGSFCHNGQQGGLYGSRQFVLSDGTRVDVRLETHARREGSQHRYLAQ